ncbi:MAG TPA: glycosyltransferase, partial [Acidimicrobiales bacterium]|nr:glycosyltransferase [Acidimicrobiales bacterium]
LLHEVQVPQVARRSGGHPVACGPVVRPAFAGSGTWSRRSARKSLGLGDEQRVALVVAGSWGVGQVERTVDGILGAPGYVPFVVAGHNERLRRSLSERCAAVNGAKVFGWVDDMERLVAASDVVVENAGGLSAMEAMALGAPVVTYAPIAGHGRANAEEMERAGVSLYARTKEELVAYLRLLSSGEAVRDELVATARAMFRDDPARLIAVWAKAGRVFPVVPERPIAGASYACPPSLMTKGSRSVLTTLQ